jgi:hypothetical protein
VADTVPFVPDRARLLLANEYAPAAGYKALALNANGTNFFTIGQPNEEAAKNSSIEQCQKRATPPRRRENARSMLSATPWSTRMAARQCRHCPGSGTTPRPKSRS